MFSHDWRNRKKTRGIFKIQHRRETQKTEIHWGGAAVGKVPLNKQRCHTISSFLNITHLLNSLTYLLAYYQLHINQYRYHYYYFLLSLWRRSIVFRLGTHVACHYDYYCEPVVSIFIFCPFYPIYIFIVLPSPETPGHHRYVSYVVKSIVCIFYYGHYIMYRLFE